MKYVEHTFDMSFDKWHEVWSIIMKDESNPDTLKKFAIWRKRLGIDKFIRVENVQHVFMRFYFKSENRLVEFKLRYG